MSSSTQACSASCGPDECALSRRGTTAALAAHSTLAWSGAPATPVCINGISVAAVESVPAHEADTLYSTVRHARIPQESAADFWRRVEALIREFVQLPRSGGTVYAFVTGLYPTDHPTLPPADDEPTQG